MGYTDSPQGQYEIERARHEEYEEECAELERAEKIIERCMASRKKDGLSHTEDLSLVLAIVTADRWLRREEKYGHSEYPGEPPAQDALEHIIRYNKKAMLEILRKHAQKHFGIGGIVFTEAQMKESTSEGPMMLYNDEMYVEVVAYPPDA